MFVNDENIVMFNKGELYKLITPSEYEFNSGIYFWIMSDLYKEPIPFTEKNFNKYFTTIDEIRNIKLNEILKK
jgi:hypothetical protein